MTRTNKGTAAWYWWIAVALGLAGLFMLTAFQSFTSEHTKVVIQAITGMSEVNAYKANVVARKAAHVLVFGLLALLLYKMFRKYAFGFAWGCTFLLALLDEWHQSLVPGRTPSIRDVLLDSAAAFIFLVLAKLIRKRR